MKKISVLYMDKYRQNLLAFNAYFKTHKSYQIHLCSDSREALQVLMDFSVDMLIVDQPYPTQTGLEFLEDLPPHIKMPIKFIVTGHRDFSLVEIAKEKGDIIDFFEKPYDLAQIDKCIKETYKNNKPCNC